MQICRNCQSENLDENVICLKCGASLTQIMNQPIQGTYSQPQVKTNPFAVASMILGIASILLICCCFYVAPITSILAVVFGFLGRSRIQKSLGMEKGSGMALAGIITGFSALGLFLIMLVLVIAFGIASPDFWTNLQKQIEQSSTFKY